MFDPTNTGGISLPIGETYDWVSGMLNYTSDIRKAFNYELGASYGGYYNGKRLALLGTFFYRIQPWGSFSVVTAYNDIELPDPYQDATLFLIGPRIDFTFTDKIFLTTFVQYNNQIDNLNVNMRFQWRFAPVSDLFIVYTSNAYPDDLRTKNRAIVAKISYWFN
jgi:hypothetical protein